MLVVSLRDDQSGSTAKLEIPGKKVTTFMLQNELHNGKYPTHFSYTHRGATLEVFFQTTEEFSNYIQWVVKQIS